MNPEQHAHDCGQIGAIIQTRLCQTTYSTNATKEYLWCRNGSICFKTPNNTPRDNQEYNQNEKGQRRRVDMDERLLLITPDATNLPKNVEEIEFVGISLTDIPCSLSSDSLASKYPDACGRVALQISGIATVPIPQNAPEFLDSLKIGDHLSIDANENNLMEFSTHEVTVGLKKAKSTDLKMHYVGMVCNMNLSPVTGPSIDILLCPHHFTVDMKKREPEINLSTVTHEMLNSIWTKFEKKANAFNPNDSIDKVKAAIENLADPSKRNELLHCIEEFDILHKPECTCPRANEVSFFGKLAVCFGLGDTEETLPGIGDALMKDMAFESIVAEIKQFVDEEVHDTESSAIFCKSSEEVPWIKAWETWAKHNQEKIPWSASLTEKIKMLIAV